jgi:hypothetical protein
MTDVEVKNDRFLKASVMEIKNSRIREFENAGVGSNPGTPGV